MTLRPPDQVLDTTSFTGEGLNASSEITEVSGPTITMANLTATTVVSQYPLVEKEWNNGVQFDNLTKVMEALRDAIIAGSGIAQAQEDVEYEFTVNEHLSLTGVGRNIDYERAAFEQLMQIAYRKEGLNALDCFIKMPETASAQYMVEQYRLAKNRLENLSANIADIGRFYSALEVVYSRHKIIFGFVSIKQKPDEA